MTLKELESFPEFKDLEHIDGNNLDMIIERPQGNCSTESAMTVQQARLLLANEKSAAQYIEFHTADNGDIGYEIIFWTAAD